MNLKKVSESSEVKIFLSAIKFYSDEGNWDLVGNNAPIFFIRDPISFPSFVHSQKRNPKTDLKVTRIMFESMLIFFKNLSCIDVIDA